MQQRRQLCIQCQSRPAEWHCDTCPLMRYCGQACADAHWIGEHAQSHREHAWDLVWRHPETGAKLFVGGVRALEDDVFMNDTPVDAVVTAIDDRFSVQEIEALVGPHRPHLRIDVDDDEAADIAYYFDAVGAFIDTHLRRNGHNVLVHCVAGHSRSVTLIIYYLMRYHARQFPTARDALFQIERVRPTAEPNRGFWRQLLRAQKRIKQVS